jgi:hypothetical protein
VKLSDGILEFNTAREAFRTGQNVTQQPATVTQCSSFLGSPQPKSTFADSFATQTVREFSRHVLPACRTLRVCGESLAFAIRRNLDELKDKRRE